MNNNLYNWHDERLVQLKGQDLDRELDQQRLLREAGLAYEDRLVHLSRRVLGGMLAFAEWLKGRTIPGRVSFKQAHKKSM